MIWRWRTHIPDQPLHAMRQDSAWVALCGLSFKGKVGSGSATEPEESATRCPSCVALLGRELPWDADGFVRHQLRPLH